MRRPLHRLFLASLLVFGAAAIAPDPSSALLGSRPKAPAAGEDGVRLRRGPYLQKGTPHSIVIRWRTDVPADSRVSFGTSLTETWSHVDESALTTEHEVELTSLQPSTKYCYSIGYSDESGARRTLAGGSEDFAFTTAPPVGASGPTRVWVLGDSGSANHRARAVRDAWVAFSGGAPPDVWLMLGDNAYEHGTDAQYQRAVFEMYPRQLATCVLWPTRGNHDRLRRGPGNDYYEFFTMPTNAEAGGIPSWTEAYYSFDYANIHFVCLDSEGTPREPGSPMLTWLTADLAATKQPWIIGFWHHPPYSHGSHDSDDPGEGGRRLVDMREFALPVAEAGGIDLALCGHSHAYERSFLLHGHYGASSTLDDSMKVDAGDGREDGGGAYRKPSPGTKGRAGAVYAVAGSSGKTSGGSFDHPVMVTSFDVLGSLVLDIEGLRLDATFLDSNGEVRDSFTIVKDSPAPK